MLANTRVILLRTHYAGNIGSVARAMANFGLADLVLVDPIANPLDHQARQLAAGGVAVLDTLRMMSLDEALADCKIVCATSDDVSGPQRRTLAGSPADLMSRFVETLPSGPCALLFGPEPHGLTTEECGRAHALLTLPAHRDYSSFNLAMAVGITLYELFNASRAHTYTMQRDPAPFQDVDRALAHLEASLWAISFLYGQNGPYLMNGVRHLVLRAHPTPQEVGMLHGLARQLEFVARKWKESETRPPTPE
jgi:tRNA/rRNA methyltransferase